MVGSIRLPLDHFMIEILRGYWFFTFTSRHSIWMNRMDYRHTQMVCKKWKVGEGRIGGWGEKKERERERERGVPRTFLELTD